MEATAMGSGCRSSEGWRRQTGHKETTSRTTSLSGTAKPTPRRPSTAGAGSDVSSQTGGGVQKQDEAEKRRNRGRGTGRRRHEVGGGEGSARGKLGVRVTASGVNGLPNNTRV
jgi:hypothetical protein